MKDQIEYVVGIPEIEDYLSLRELNGWHGYPKDRALHGLNNSLFSVYAQRREKVIGFARIVGDGYTYFYIQDVLVHPQYQNNGIGSEIMSRIMKFVFEKAPLNTGSFISVMIAPGLKKFYNKYGFETYPDNSPGMRIWRNGH